MRQTSPSVTWHAGSVSREDRWRCLGASGATVWLTGLPASGKSTVAVAVEQHLLRSGRFAYVLDGDNLRHGLCGDLGFSAVDRTENVRRVAQVARLYADAGVIALVSIVSPYADDRASARALHEADGLPFAEVFVDTPPEECERRDPKGLWARARAGQLPEFTGVDDVYERPASPELLLTPELPLGRAVEEVLPLITQGLPPSSHS